MKQPWNTSLRLTCGAMALMGASLAFAQTTPSTAETAAPAVAPTAETSAPVAAPTTQDVQRQPMKKHHTAKPKHHSANKYASPAQHEAAAVADERRRGVGPANPAQGNQMTEYQRNALQRCEVFKTDEDRRACVERVRQPQISGSVEGGGVIREYTQTVQIPASSAPQPAQQLSAPGSMTTTPPVQPAR